MSLQLSHAHQSTYDAVLRHPSAHNLHWRDVRSMLAEIAVMTEEPNGNIKFTRNGQTLMLHPTQDKNLEGEQQIHDLRAFLVRSNEELPGDGGAAPPGDGGVNLLVVIDHRQARIYRTSLGGTKPERIEPYDPDGSGRHLHYVQNDSNGQRRPERRSYYDAIAKALRGADKVLLFGGGTGSASAMEQLNSELALHHKDIAAKVIGTVHVDDSHLTEDQLLAKSREYYASVGAA